MSSPLPPKRIVLLDSVPMPSHQRGVTRCFDEMAAQFMGDEKYQCSWVSERPAPAAAATARGLRDYSKLLRLLKRARAPMGRTKALLAGLVKSDIVLDAYYSTHVKTNRRALIVYDMIHESRPLSFPPGRKDVVRFVSNKRHCFTNSKWLLCISDSTRKDAAAHYPDIAAKCHVVHLGVNDSADSGRTVTRPRPYFLFVGNRIGYKNYLRCLMGFAASGAAATHDLVVATPLPGPTEDEDGLAQELGVAGQVHFLVSPDDAEIAALYRGATALVYPSLHEGFGFPVIEGMRERTIVLCGDNTSVAEIAGGHARLFDASRSTSIAETMAWTLQLSGPQREEHLAQAFQHSRKFTWQATKQTLDDVFWQEPAERAGA